MTTVTAASAHPPAAARDTRALPVSARLVRGVRRLLRLDRERRWNREYAAGGWDWLRNLDELAHHAILAGYVARLKPGGSVLDVGCGEGVLHEVVAPHLGRYLGVDFEAPIAKAAPRASATSTFVVGDMNDFTTTDRFDVVIFNESIYYLHDPREGFMRYFDFLAPGGVMLVSMHGKPRNEAFWAAVATCTTELDAVTVVNRAGTRWTVKALTPGAGDGPPPSPLTPA